MSGETVRQDLRRRTIQLELEGEEGVGLYSLRELKGSGRDTLVKKMKELGTVKPDGTFSVSEAAKYQTELLALSLYDASGRLVPIEIISEWPARVLESLCKKVDEINALSRVETIALGKVSSANGSSGSGSPTA